MAKEKKISDEQAARAKTRWNQLLSAFRALRGLGVDAKFDILPKAVSAVKIPGIYFDQSASAGSKLNPDDPYMPVRVLTGQDTEEQKKTFFQLLCSKFAEHGVQFQTEEDDYTVIYVLVYDELPMRVPAPVRTERQPTPSTDTQFVTELLEGTKSEPAQRIELETEEESFVEDAAYAAAMKEFEEEALRNLQETEEVKEAPSELEVKLQESLTAIDPTIQPKNKKTKKQNQPEAVYAA